MKTGCSSGSEEREMESHGGREGGKEEEREGGREGGED